MPCDLSQSVKVLFELQLTPLAVSLNLGFFQIVNLKLAAESPDVYYQDVTHVDKNIEAYSADQRPPHNTSTSYILNEVCLSNYVAE